MDNTKPNAARCMRAWREAQVPKLTQRGLAAQMKGAHQSQIALWEKEDAPERPDLARALELQAISRGEVPAPLWGYTTEEIERVLAEETERMAREDLKQMSLFEQE